MGQAYSSRTIDLDSEQVTEVTIEPASEQEVSDTIAVMGGEDWKRWIDMLMEENLLAAGARTLAYSYIGPEMTLADLSRWNHRAGKKRSRSGGE